MSPKPFVTSQYDHAPDCDCPRCFEFRCHNPHLYGAQEQPQMSWRPIRVALACTLTTLAILAFLWFAFSPDARAKTPKPIPAPAALLRARAACPIARPLKCRAALRQAYAAIEWQRQARWHKTAGTTTDVVRDAINWASSQTGVAAWRMIRIGTCESHLYWRARTGQYKGWAQLGAMHRSDPIFRVVPWQDPYAQAIHMARFIKAHGEQAWQCTSSGGLRW